MRFYPSSPFIAREASKQVEIGGYVLPQGTWIWFSPRILTKHPKNFSKTSICFDSVWTWTATTYWSEIFHARDEADANSSLPKIFV
ncbi:hypothetical protein C5167_029751 [Papaver somniferum]|nr:hypothetical protein C5167_029751 [Papaver somniferum]